MGIGGLFDYIIDTVYVSDERGRGGCFLGRGLWRYLLHTAFWGLRMLVSLWHEERTFDEEAFHGGSINGRLWFE